MSYCYVETDSIYCFFVLRKICYLIESVSYTSGVKIWSRHFEGHHSQISGQFRSIIIRFKRIDYNLNVM